MKKLINSQKYEPKGKRLDAVWCYDDTLVQGITQALPDTSGNAVHL